MTAEIVNWHDSRSTLVSGSKADSHRSLSNSIGNLPIPDNNNNNNSTSNNNKNNQADTHSRLLPVTVTWRNIHVSLPAKRRTLARLRRRRDAYDIEETNVKSIIQNVDGIARPGEVLAIMGASGSGKTSLLNAINLRTKKTSLRVAGNIRLNGQLVKSIEDISSISGYVQQDDLFIGHMTVKEHLVFQAMLRMETHIGKADRMTRVDQVLHDLNLEKCRDTLIGVFGTKGISGGEKRRLAFASEIITNPSILFCDEPTSGLDSFMALSVAEIMKELAAGKGTTIICTIHQPSSEIYELFDKLCLLAEGRLAFYGDLSQASSFFASQGHPVPSNYNPADFYIKKLAILSQSRDQCLIRMNKICDGFSTSEMKAELNKQIDSLDKSVYPTATTSTAHKSSKRNTKSNQIYKSTVFAQMFWLLWRNLLGLLRDPFSLKIQIFQTLTVSLMFGLIYLRLKYDQQGVMDMNGYLFLCMCNNGFATMFLVVNTFPIELPVFMRDHENRMYRVISYYVAKLLTDLPNFVILPILFMSIAYWMANLNDKFDRFIICVLVIILVVQCSLAFGTFLSAVSPSTNVALALAGPVLVPLMIFSGFLLNYDSIPKYFIWLRYLSWFSYANELLQCNQWSGVEHIECASNATLFCFANGQQVIQYLKVNPDNFYFNIGCMLALIVLWRSVAFVVLLIKTR